MVRITTRIRRPVVGTTLREHVDTRGSRVAGSDGRCSKCEAQGVNVKSLGGVATPSPSPARSLGAGLGTPTQSVARAFLEMFAGGPLPEWDSFARTIRLVRLRPGEVLFEAGVEHPYIYVVRRGSIRVGFADQKGRECLLAFCRPPDMLASVSAIVPAGVRRLSNLPHGITKLRGTAGVGVTNSRATALEMTELERLDFRIMERLMTRHSQWALAVYNAMILHTLAKEQRERELLTLTPEERYRQFLDDHDDLIGVVPQKDIARYLGVTPVGLSRIASRVRSRAVSVPTFNPAEPLTG